MNHRINELLNAAGFVRYSPEENPATPIDWSCNYSKEMEKFAELIVKDVLRVVAAHTLSNDSAMDVFVNLKRLYEDE